MSLSVYPAGITVPYFFDTFKGADGSSITLTGLAVTDIEIYKGTSMTQRSSDNGYALIDTDGIDLDGITGIHGFSVDLSDNTDAGFYAAGSIYHVVVSTVTIDGVTVSFIADRFRLVAAEGTAGTPVADATRWNNLATVELPLVPTTAGRKLDVSATGEAGVDWANVGSPTTVVGLSGTTVKTATDVETDTADIQTRLPAALVSGRMDSSTGAMAANVVTAAAVADAAIDRATFAADTGLVSIRSNTAQAGGATTITLDASASAVNDFYANQIILLTGGTGAGESKIIASYVGATKVATVNDAWATNPDNTSTFAILPFGSVPGATAPTAVQIRTEIDSNSTQLAAIKAKTDSLTFTVANQVDSNVKSNAGTALTAAAGVQEVKVASMATGALSGAAVHADAGNKIADHVNRRTQANVEASSDGDAISFRSIYGATAKLVNKVSISGTTLTVTKSDDATSLGTQALTTDAAALPITAADTA